MDQKGERLANTIQAGSVSPVWMFKIVDTLPLARLDSNAKPGRNLTTGNRPALRDTLPSKLIPLSSI